MAKKIFTDTEYVKNEIEKALGMVDVSAQINLHNTSQQAHEDIRTSIASNTQQITVLSADRGYKDSKTLTNVDFNTITRNGKYYITSPTANKPTTNENYFILDVSSSEAGLLIHRLNAPFQGISWERSCAVGNWTPWKQLATTEKTEILFPFSDECMTTAYISKIVKQNGRCILYIGAKKKDGTNFVAGASTVLGILPTSFSTDANVHTGGRGENPNCVISGTIFQRVVTAYTPVACKEVGFIIPYDEN